MITTHYETEESWLEARKGKVTGSRLGDLVVKRGTGEKKAFYEIIAERIAQEAEDEDPRDRGHRLEEEAIEMFEKIIKKKVDTSLVIWERNDNRSIAISPDGFIGETEAVEVKCLSSASHIEAIVTNQMPKEYEFQKLQYFIVNDKLETLYFVMYDPRMPENLQVKHFTITRDEVKDEIEEYHKYQIEKLARIEEIINELTF